MPGKRQKWFKAGILCVLGIALLSISYLAWRRTRPFYMHPTMAIAEGTNLYRLDAELGYATKPGEYHISISSPNESGALTFKATIGADGNRICEPTSGSAGAGNSRTQVWMFGCSYSWGWGVNDEAALPWLVQQRLPQIQLHNFCCNGHGQTQELLALRRAISSRADSLPAIALFCFSQFHLERNVAAPQWISLFRGVPAFEQCRYPRARLKDGHLSFDSVRLFPSKEEAASLQSVPMGEMESTAVALLAEIAAECHSHGIRPLLVVQLGEHVEHVLDQCQRLDFSIVDVRLDINCVKELNLMPYDCHPSPKAHQQWAAALTPAILREIQRSSNAAGQQGKNSLR